MSTISGYLDPVRRTQLAADIATQAMDETAEWAAENKPTHHLRRRADDADMQISIKVLEQSLAHYFRAGRALNTDGQPLDASKRAAYDPDYGTFADHPMDPRTENSDAVTEDEARAEATEQTLSYAESVADWLAKACDTPAGREPVRVLELTPMRIISGGPDLLLTVLMAGDNTQVLRAVHRLRELAAIEFRPAIDSRTASILEAQ